MSAWVSLFMVVLLVLLVFLGVGAIGLNFFFGVFIPYVAIALFIGGVIYRVVKWAKSPVPFRIPTTCGQQKTLPWIKANNLESPYNTLGVVARMALEVFFFRSLFRNTKVDLREGPKLAYGSAKWLWLAGLAFHWSFLFILIRHLRLFTEPVPFFVNLLNTLDGLFQIALPTLYITDAVILVAVTYLFLRRYVIQQVRYN